MNNKVTSKVYTTENAGSSVELSILPVDTSNYMTVETKITNYESLLDAMKAQAEKNKEIVDEIFEKDRLFNLELSDKLKK
jgi:hypothetical protein